MDQINARDRHRTPWLFSLAAISGLGWLGYKAINSWRFLVPMTTAAGCQTEHRATADLSRFTSGAAPVSCEPWDIGTGVAGYVWHAPGPRAALLLLHGLGDYAHRYVTQNNRLIPHLLRLGVSVYAFDMWGSGHSPGTRGATDARQAVADHLAARRTLRQQPLPVFLLGNSLGGLVTATSVVRDERDVRGVILIAPALKIDVNPLLRGLARAGGFLVPTLPGPVPPGTIDLLTRDPEARAVLAGDPLLHAGRITWVVAGTVPPMAHENWPRYPKLRVPVLAMHGTADQGTNPDGSRRLIEIVASEDKTLHLVPGGYHSLLDDTERDETLNVLLTWLEQRLPAAGSDDRATSAA